MPPSRRSRPGPTEVPHRDGGPVESGWPTEHQAVRLAAWRRLWELLLDPSGLNECGADSSDRATRARERDLTTTKP